MKRSGMAAVLVGGVAAALMGVPATAAPPASGQPWADRAGPAAAGREAAAGESAAVPRRAASSGRIAAAGTCTGNGTGVRPRYMRLVCVRDSHKGGDRLKWRSWGKKKAVAVGLDGYSVKCTACRVVKWRARFELSRPRVQRGIRMWTRLAITARQQIPPRAARYVDPVQKYVAEFRGAEAGAPCLWTWTQEEYAGQDWGCPKPSQPSRTRPTPPRPGADTVADVDGDGVWDRVLVSAGSGATVVTVTTGAGRTVSGSVPYDGNQGGLPVGERLLGAAEIDGVPGHELVLFSALGDCGHYDVLTWRGGSLVRLPAPPKQAWSVCSKAAAPVGSGFRRPPGKAVFYGYDSDSTVRGRDKIKVRVFTWRNGKWRKTSTKTLLRPGRRASRLYTADLPWLTPPAAAPGTPTQPGPAPTGAPTAAPSPPTADQPAAPPAPEPDPTSEPPPTTPPPPPPPASAVITGNPCTTFEAAPNCAPARVSAAANNTATRLGEFGYGQKLTARCWTTGQTITDGNNADPSDDARTFTSNRWYGIDWNGGRGYVAATWTTKTTSTLGLPAC